MKKRIPLLIGVTLLAAVLLHPEAAFGFAKKLLSPFTPFYIGFAAAYLLNPALRLLEEKVLKKIDKPPQRRGIALLLTYSLLAALLGGGAFFLIPRLIHGISGLMDEIPHYYQTAAAFVEKYPLLSALGEKLYSWLSGMVPQLADMTLKAGKTVLNSIIGLVLSVYLLHAKERLIAQCKKVLNFVCKDDLYKKVLRVGAITHQKTLRYITARLLDSLIVAVITYLFMLIFRVPYALLSALSVGIFNTIPFFGSWLGAIPPGLIILATKPSMLLPYLIYIVLLEQLDGNFIGPRLQGKQLGLSPLWIIFAIFLFGGLFGFAGMVVGVPFFAVLYYFVTAAVNNGLHKQGKSSETADYAAPEDREIIEENGS